ncbi:MAG TPA: AIPR family protein [Xanthobacteraceae bacterium]|nr:AIPR family protein [Xanthobacteraceae bacterium]
MKEADLEYANMVKAIRSYIEKGRPISIAFLNWFLEHIYRLDQVSAEDAICDKSNDRGIDGIYVDENQLEIDVLQSKTKQNGTIGDKDLRELSGTLNQLRSVDALDAFLAGKVDQEIKDKIEKLGLRGLLEKGFAVRGIFVTNVPIDANGLDVIKADPSIIAYDRSRIVQDYVDLNIEGGIKQKYTFSIDGSPLQFQAGALAKVLVLFTDGKELAALPGIADGSLFELNVRLPLGSTKVNKAIRDSIEHQQQHVKFPLFHNGITVLAEKVEVGKGAVTIENFVVVNGAQSLKQFRSGEKRITSDLEVLTRIIEIGGNTDLAREISINSNNQNGIKPRDLRSNDAVQVRLQAEFEKLSFKGYSFDVRRGEEGTANTISNEYAGKLLLAFDLNEPWSCHQTYKVFDEKYADIFARPEVTAHRIIFLAKIMSLVEAHLERIENPSSGHYGLTKYTILATIKKLLSSDPLGTRVCQSPTILFKDERMDCVLQLIDDLLTSIIIDLNHEMRQGTLSDYKSDLKSKNSVEKLISELLRSYEKDRARGKAEAIGDRLKACGIDQSAAVLASILTKK